MSDASAGRFQVMPPLTQEEYDELEADIVANGVMVAILEDERGNVIDGHHRKAIATRHNLRCPTLRCPPNLSDEAKRTLALNVNIHRRQLTREQKRELIARSLVADPQLSDRQHAERTGADHKTVGTVRDELVNGGEIPHQDTRVGKDGVTQPATKSPTVTTTHRESISDTVKVDQNTGEVLERNGVPQPAPDPLGDFLADDAGVQLASWRHAFSRDLTHLSGLLLWKPDEIAANADPALIDEMAELASRLIDRVAEIQQLRSPALRVVNGGAR